MRWRTQVEMVATTVAAGRTDSAPVAHRFSCSSGWDWAPDSCRSHFLFADFGSNALTGQTLVVSHGWFMLWPARLHRMKVQ